MSRVIGFCGPAGCGKTRISRELAKLCDGEIISMADPVKFIAADAFGWDGVKDARGRRLLQVIGTEAGRAYDENIWVKAWREMAEDLLKFPTEVVICDDVRFQNEADEIRALGGVVVRLEGRRAEMPENTSAHSSESSGQALADYSVPNHEGRDAVLVARQIAVCAGFKFRSEIKAEPQ